MIDNPLDAGVAATQAILEQRIATFKNRDDIAGIIKVGGVGVELGVAEGRFSERILKRSQLEHLFSIDMWAGDRGHDVN